MVRWLRRSYSLGMIASRCWSPVSMLLTGSWRHLKSVFDCTIHSSLPIFAQRTHFLAIEHHVWWCAIAHDPPMIGIVFFSCEKVVQVLKLARTMAQSTCRWCQFSSEGNLHPRVSRLTLCSLMASAFPKRADPQVGKNKSKLAPASA